MSENKPLAPDNLDYLPIRLGTLRPDAQLLFDVYIKVADKMIHYVKKAEPFEGDRLEKLKTKGIKKLFIPYADEELYLNYLDNGLNQLKNANASIEEKADVAHSGLVTMAGNPEGMVRNETSYNRSQVQIGKVVEFILNDASAAKTIAETVGLSQDLQAHCANVATLAIALANECKITDSAQLLDLGMAAMLHDVGLLHIGVDLTITPDTMTKEQTEKYHSHANVAKELLVGRKFIGVGVLNLIADHEEIGKGRGYPYKKHLSKLSLTSQVLNVCNFYDRLCQRKGIILSAGLDEFYATGAEHFDPKLVQSLAKVIKGA